MEKEFLAAVGMMLDASAPLRIIHLQNRLFQLELAVSPDYCDSGKPRHEGLSLFLRKSGESTFMLVQVEAIPGIREAGIGWVHENTVDDFPTSNRVLMQPNETAGGIARDATLEPQYNGDTIEAVSVPEYYRRRHECLKAELEELQKAVS